MSVADLDVSVHETVIEMIAAYACYALDDDDAELVDGHLVDCTLCRVELDESLAALASLSGPDEAPGEHVWLGIAAATGGLDAFDDDLDTAADPDAASATSSVWSRINAALHEDVPLRPEEIVLTRRWIKFFAISGAVAVALILALIAGQDVAIDQVRDTSAIDSERLAALDAMVDPASVEVTFGWVDVVGASAGDIPLTAIVRGDDAWLVRSNLDELEAGTYQLWFDVDGTLRPVAVLGTAVNVTSFDLDSDADALVVTAEHPDGATTPVARADLGS